MRGEDADKVAATSGTEDLETEDRVAAASGIEDLEPTPHCSKARTWNWQVFSFAWIVMIVNPGSLTCGAVLLSLGLSPLEATMSHSIGGVILMVALQLQAWPGVKYGIPFPIAARASFGVDGAHFCTLSRGMVAIMWLSWQTWQATLGICIAADKILCFSLTRWGRLDSHVSAFQLLIFLVLILLHALVVWLGIERFHTMIYIVTPVACVGLVAIAIWTATLATFEQSMNAARSASKQIDCSHVQAWVIGITSSVATWSTLVLNACDLSRYCPTQCDQCVGQAIGVPIPFGITGFIGIWAAGATRHVYGVAMWQVPQYFDTFTPSVAGVSAIMLAASLLAVNILANIISPINDLMNLAPKRLTFRGCGYLCLVLSALVCPWWTFANPHGFVLTFLNGYAVITGAITGVLMFDFWFVNSKVLDLQKLYKPQAGCCYGHEKVNLRAFIAVVVAVIPCFPGFLHTLPDVDVSSDYVFNMIYSASWFSTFLGAGGVYYFLSKGVASCCGVMLGYRKLAARVSLSPVTEEKWEVGDVELVESQIHVNSTMSAKAIGVKISVIETDRRNLGEGAITTFDGESETSAFMKE